MAGRGPPTPYALPHGNAVTNLDTWRGLCWRESYRQMQQSDGHWFDGQGSLSPFICSDRILRFSHIIYLTIQNNVLLYSSIRVWRSLVSRLNGVQEASSSNLDTRSKKAETVSTVSAFFFCVEIRTNKCNSPVDCCLAGRGPPTPYALPYGNAATNLDTRTII